MYGRCYEVSIVGNSFPDTPHEIVVESSKVCSNVVVIDTTHSLIQLDTVYARIRTSRE